VTHYINWFWSERRAPFSSFPSLECVTT